MVLVATAGHVDHGKSTLIRVLTGTDPDRFAEERRRGMTLDLGYAHTEVNGRLFAFVDVPGHHRYVHNMLAGIGSVDAALMVIAADESIMPQTREHARALHFLGVSQVIVVITKFDLIDHDLADLLHQELDEWLAEYGWSTAPRVAFSHNDQAAHEAMRTALANLKPCPDATFGQFRFAIDRIFTKPGSGVVVTGSADRGMIKSDDHLCAPDLGDAPIRVRELQSHDRCVSSCEAHARLAINLADLHHQQLSRGQCLFTQPGPLPVTRILVRIHYFENGWSPGSKHQLHVHHLTAHLTGRVLWRDGDIACMDLDQSHPWQARDRGLIRDGSPLCVTAGFVVLWPDPPHRRRRKLASFLQNAPLGNDLAAFQRWFLERQNRPFHREAMIRFCGSSFMDELQDQVVILGERLLAKTHWDQAVAKVLELLDEAHRAAPLYQWLPLVHLTSRWREAGGDPGLLNALLPEMVTGEVVQLQEDRVKHPRRRAVWTPQRKALLQNMFEASRISPHMIDVRQLPPGDYEALIAMLRWTRALYALDEHLFIRNQDLGRIILELERRQSQGGFAISEFKDWFKLTRKTAIPLLMLLDKLGFTRRDGDHRVWIAESSTLPPSHFESPI